MRQADKVVKDKTNACLLSMWERAVLTTGRSWTLVPDSRSESITKEVLGQEWFFDGKCVSLEHWLIEDLLDSTALRNHVEESMMIDVDCIVLTYDAVAPVCLRFSGDSYEKGKDTVRKEMVVYPSGWSVEWDYEYDFIIESNPCLP